jgi:hypothetical protein
MRPVQPDFAVQVRVTANFGLHRFRPANSLTTQWQASEFAQEASRPIIKGTALLLSAFEGIS